MNYTQFRTRRLRRSRYPSNAQLKVGHATTYPKRGDVLIDGKWLVENGKWLVEIGGKGKGFDQIADIENSFVVNDGIEVGRGNKIPLWLFGMMY